MSRRARHCQHGRGLAERAAACRRRFEPMRVALAAALLFATAAAAQEAPRGRDSPPSATAARPSSAQALREARNPGVGGPWVPPPGEEGTRDSHGRLTVRGARIPYPATAGTLTIRDDDGKPTA